MTSTFFRLFTGQRLVPHDGIADEEACAADDRLAADLRTALAAAPVADAGHRIRLDQRQGGQPCSS